VGSRGFSQKIFQGGGKSGEIWFLPLEIEKTTFFADIFKIQGGQGPPPPSSDAHTWSYIEFEVSNKQRWATATLLSASLPLFMKFNTGATAPVTE